MDDSDYLKNLIERRKILRKLYNQNNEIIDELVSMGYLVIANDFNNTNKRIMEEINLLSKFISYVNEGNTNG